MPAVRHLSCLILATFALPAFAASGPALAGIPLEFILFALTLLGVALLHNATLYVATGGGTGTVNLSSGIYYGNARTAESATVGRSANS